MERIIKNRLSWYLESNHLLQQTQAGFRPGRSTMDHIVDLENHGKIGFSIVLQLPSFWTLRYNHTLHDGVLYKLACLSVNGRILNGQNPSSSEGQPE